MRSRSLLVLAGLVLFLLQAVRSEGYYHPDEYFQTIGFASHKLGRAPASDLPWEFAGQMRPFLQPAAYFVLAQGINSLGLKLDEPRPFLLVFRLGSALLSFLSLGLLGWALSQELSEERHKNRMVAACLFTWYLPFLGVRTSSECLSGSFLALGLAAWLLLRDRPWLGALASGLALGLAFEHRYQTALCAAGFFAWLAIVRRSSVKELSTFVFGFAVPAVVGLWVDRWGYGAWVFAPWNYLRANLIEGRAADWGTEPFTFYFRNLLEVQAPLSALLLVAVLILWFRAPKAAITWMTVPFVLVHTLLAHKEPRFLFPLGPLAAAIPPLLLFDSKIRWARLSDWAERHGWLVVGLNCAYLVVLLVLPIRHDLSVDLDLGERLLAAPLTEVALLHAEPFTAADLSLTFLRPPRYSPVSVDSWAEAERFAESSDRAVCVVALLSDFPPEDVRARLGLRLVSSPVVEGLARRLSGPLHRTALIALWSTEGTSPQ